jgi:hypothetical protein
MEALGTVERKKRYSAAATGRDREDIIKEALDESEALKKKTGLGGIDRESLERGRGAVKGFLEERLPHEQERLGGSYGRDERIKARLPKIREILKGAGMSEQELAEAIVPNFSQIKETLGQKKLSDEDIKKVLDAFTEFPLKASVNLDVLKKAQGGGLQTAYSALEGLRSKYGLAFQKEMQPQLHKVEDVRGMIQNISLGKDQLDVELLKIQRAQYDQLLKSGGLGEDIKQDIKKILGKFG